MQTLGHIAGTTANMGTCLFDRDALMQGRAAQGGDIANSSVGAIVRVMVAGTPVFATLVEIAPGESDTAGGSVLATLEYIGEGRTDADGALAAFQRGLTAYPQPGDAVRFATEAELASIFAPPDAPHISIGRVHPTREVRAPIVFDQFLGRHFAVVGSSGAGKSTTVALLLDRIIEQARHGHVIILDPHGEYAHAFGDRARLWDVRSLRLPYWAMNHEEHCDVFITGSAEERAVDSNILSQCLLRARQRNIAFADSGRITADTPVAYQIADLTDALEAEAGRLEKLADAHRYTHLRLTIEQYFADRRYSFIFDPDLASATIEGMLGDLLRIPSGGSPISIVDLAGVPTEIVNVVVATLARLILDYAIWSPRESRVPVLLVCEEAHRYLPAVRSERTRAVERQLERIAREGRKYGVCLGLVTQRPSELSETALSQCGTIIAMRLNNRNDQAHIAAALSEGAQGMVGSLSTLRNRECIISGEGVPIPMRVLIDALDAARRPASDDPVFSESWREEKADGATLAETVRRWREER